MRIKIIATALAVAVATSTMSAPASAYYGYSNGWKKVVKMKMGKKGGKAAATSSSSNMGTGKIVVGCIFGGALGVIVAALAKGKAYNDPKIELTQNEVWPIFLSCGLGAGPVIASFNRP
jgi:L-asparagine transporter-like permease